MKRNSIFIAILLLCVCTAQAQKGLSIERFFDSKWAKATFVHVEGQELKPYGLTLYRSATFSDAHLVVDAIEKAVQTDSRQAGSKEVGSVGEHLYYAFLALSPSEGKTVNRYIFYRNSSLRENGRDEITLVYMEGSVTMERLKNLFKK